MTTAGSEPEPAQSPREGTLEARLPGYRFGVVLLLLLATFVFLASGPSGGWVRPVTVLLQGATLLAAFVAARVRLTLLRCAIVVVAICFAASMVAAFSDEPTGGGVAALLSAFLVAAAPIAIAGSIWRRRVIDVQTVLGALCIYVLLGMLWAFVYTAIGDLGSEPFFAQQSTASTADYLYFSFVTQTTVGYGDLTAAGGLGRPLAVVEALVGQIYLVTIVALMVSNLGRGRAPRGSGRTG